MVARLGLADREDIRDVLVHTTGANFHPVPGDYVLPQREGTYSVYPDLQGDMFVTMNTKGGAQTYDHKLVTYLQP